MLKLMYITNCPITASIAEASGVDRIFIDLEIIGKKERQGHLDTVISDHRLEDIEIVKKVLTKSELLVRINPLHHGSETEIDIAVKNGADIIMLPYFTEKHEVESFVRFVRGRVKTCLLLETPRAVENIDEILSVDGIDMIHIGLNDLHLGYGMKFMFELLADGTVERLCKKISDKGISYGFGGIARLNFGELPAEHIIAEHYRLGSEMVILSRSFCNLKTEGDIKHIENLFKKGVSAIRNFEKSLMLKDEKFFIVNKKTVFNKVSNICLEKSSKSLRSVAK